MKEQLNKIMEAEGMSPARFADEIGVQRSSISHIISGRNKPSYDFIMKILDRFKGVNAEWLLTGNGSMIKGHETAINTQKSEQNLFYPDKALNYSGNEINDKSRQKDFERLIPDDNTFELSKNKPPSNQSAGSKLPEFTNVNDVKFILVFYKDGSFEQHNPRG